MKIKNLLIEKMEREPQGSPTNQREDIAVSSQDINKIMETRNFFDVAMFYASQNIKVFPVKRQDKKPLCASGFKSASMDMAQLQEWNKKFTDCNIGIPTGDINGIFVVDVDGEQGFKSLTQIEQLHSKLIAPTVITGKGKHLYFKMPTNTKIKSSVSKIANHIDIRADGGYVVAPPSIHTNGKQYIWENFAPSHKFPDAPQWLLDIILNAENENSSIEELLEEIANAPEGTRNDILISNAGKIQRLAEKQFLSLEDFVDDLIQAGLDSGLSRNEVLQTIQNALKYEEKDNRNKTVSEPDMDILKTKDLLPAPKLNTQCFKNLEPWIIQTAENTNAPVDYVAFSLLASAAGVVGLSRSISPWEEWQEPCCLWIGVIGEPSSNKTPATQPVKRILNQLEDNRKVEYQKKLSFWKTEKEVAKQRKKEWEERVKESPDTAPLFPTSAKTPTKPQTPRFVYGDTTQEAIVKDMENNIKGAIVFRDELSAWLTGMNRYNGGNSERGFWLEAFNGHRFTSDRVKFDDERLEIKNLLISVFGTIQPQRLTDTVLSDRGDGFLARFLWVYPEPVAPAIPSNRALPENVLAAFDKLDSLLNPYVDNTDKQKKCLLLSIEAQQIFNTWYLAHLNKSQQEESILQHFLGKGQGYVLRLALLLELLWWASSENDEPTRVSLEAVQAAIELYDSYLTPMCERVYNMYYSPTKNLEARALAKWIIEHKPSSFVLREIYNDGNIANLRRKEQAQKAADRLVSLGWLHFTSTRNGTTAGRRRTTYYVNPEVYELAKDL